ESDHRWYAAIFSAVWPGTPPPTIKRGFINGWATEPRRRSTKLRCLGFEPITASYLLIISMRAAVALVPDRALSRRPPSLELGWGTTQGRPNGEPVDDGRAPHPLGHRAGQREGGRAAPAAGLRRAAQAGRAEAGPRETRPDARGHGPGPRGLSSARGYR